MRLLRNFPALTFTLVFLSIIALALSQQSITLLLVAGALAAVSWYITEGPRGRSLPKWVSHVLIAAVALYTAAELVQSLHDVHGVLGRFGLWLTLIKLYERNTARDHGHLLMLSFLLMLVACLQAGGLLFSIILIAYVVLGIYVLLLYQLYAAHERARVARRQSMPGAAAEPAGAIAPLPPMKPIIGQHVALNFRTLVAAVGLSGLVLGTFVFVVFPRGLLEETFARLGAPGARPRAGFAEEVNLIQGGRITDSRRVVMSVQLLDQGGEPIQFYEPLRLRGAVFDRYRGDGRWDLALMSSERFEVEPYEFTHLAPIDPQPARTLTQIVRSRTEPRSIFSLYLPVAVSADRAPELAYDPRTQLVTIPERGLPPLTYRVRVQPVPTDDAVEQLVLNQHRGRQNLHMLRHPAVRELAQRIVRDAGYTLERPAHNEDALGHWRWARDVAHILTRYLHSDKFRYTLDLDFILPEENDGYADPIRYFLLEARRGHCEYFASALVALCENLGVESRLVTGYLVTEYNDLARRYDVLERNAHAWVEVRTGEGRWVTFDPTPPAALGALTTEPASLTERLQSLYDRFDSVWSHNILAFDSRAQKRLAERWDLQLADRLALAGAVVREWFLAANVAFALGPAGSIYLGFVILLLLVAIYVLVRLVRRRRAVRRAAHLEHVRRKGMHGFWEVEYQRLLRDAGFYLETLEALERRGMAKPKWMPPLAYSDDLAQRNPTIAEVMRELTGLFYRSRYGMQPLTAEEVALVRSRISEIAANS